MSRAGAARTPVLGLQGLDVAGDLGARAGDVLRAILLLLDQLRHQEHLLLGRPERAAALHAEEVAEGQRPVDVHVVAGWEGYLFDLVRLGLRAINGGEAVKQVPLEPGVGDARRLPSAPACKGEGSDKVASRRGCFKEGHYDPRPPRGLG